jgi:hypothetical protein
MTNSEFAAGLRQLAEVYEAHPEMVAPPRIDINLYGVPREVYAKTVRALGSFRKVEPHGTDYFYEIEKVIGGLPVRFATERANVCRKVRVMKEVEDWDCSDPILEALASEVTA